MNKSIALCFESSVLCRERLPHSSANYCSRKVAYEGATAQGNQRWRLAVPILPLDGTDHFYLHNAFPLLQSLRAERNICTRPWSTGVSRDGPSRIPLASRPSLGRSFR